MVEGAAHAVIPADWSKRLFTREYNGAGRLLLAYWRDPHQGLGEPLKNLYMSLSHDTLLGSLAQAAQRGYFESYNEGLYSVHLYTPEHFRADLARFAVGMREPLEGLRDEKLASLCDAGPWREMVRQIRYQMELYQERLFSMAREMGDKSPHTALTPAQPSRLATPAPEPVEWRWEGRELLDKLRPPALIQALQVLAFVRGAPHCDQVLYKEQDELKRRLEVLAGWMELFHKGEPPVEMLINKAQAGGVYSDTVFRKKKPLLLETYDVSDLCRDLGQRANRVRDALAGLGDEEMKLLEPSETKRSVIKVVTDEAENYQSRLRAAANALSKASVRSK